MLTLIALAGMLLENPLNDPCQDDRGKDRCAEDVQAKTLKLFGAQPLDELATNGQAVRRVFYVDGYGTDVAAVEFIRPQGATPFVRVRGRLTDGIDKAEIQAPVSDADWQELVEESRRLESLILRPTEIKQLKQSDAEDEDTFRICLHSWVYWAEAAGEGKRRTAVNDACNDSMVEEFAWFAANKAFERLTACHPLENVSFRTQANRLAMCANFEGDVAAAAAAYRDTDRLHTRDIGEGRNHKEVRMSYDTQLIIDGTSIDRDAQQTAWDTLAEGDVEFYYHSITGRSANQVNLEGRFYRNIEELDDNYIADARDVLLIFARQRANDNFSLKAATIGPWSPHKQPIE